MQPFLRIIEALNKHEASYIVIGGVATNLHGYSRLTTDLDLVVSFDQRGLKSVLDALQEIGYLPMIPVDPMGLANAEIRTSWIEDKGMIALAFFDPKLPIIRVDLMTNPVVPYRELERDLVIKDLGGRPVRICSVDHLIRLKKEAGRPQDLDDIEVLERLKESD